MEVKLTCDFDWLQVRSHVHPIEQVYVQLPAAPGSTRSSAGSPHSSTRLARSRTRWAAPWSTTGAAALHTRLQPAEHHHTAAASVGDAMAGAVAAATASASLWSS